MQNNDNKKKKNKSNAKQNKKNSKEKKINKKLTKPKKANYSTMIDKADLYEEELEDKSYEQ